VGLTYCNQQANDGRFSAASARIMTGYLASPELGRGAMAELCAAGLWAETADGFEVHDYLEYQPSQEERCAANKAAAERMRKMRAAKHGVREPLQRNTAGTSPELPPKFSLPDPVPSRPDPVPVLDHTVVPSEPSQPDLPLQPQQAAVGADDGQAHKAQPEATGQAKASTAIPKPQVAKQIALTLFGELQAARKRCNPNIRLDCKIKNATDGIERCLKDGSTPDDIRHVIACWEALVKTGARRMQDFDHMTPFSPSKVGKYLMMTLEDAAKPRPGYSKPAVPEKPKTQPKEPSEWEKRRDAFLREQAEKNKEAENNS